MQDFSVVAFLN